MVLDKADCEALFAKLNFPKDARLKSFHLEPFTKDILGYLGEHLRLTLIPTSGDEISLFVKVVAETKGMLKCFEDLPIFEKELFVYEFIDHAAEVVQNPRLDTSVVPKLLYTKITARGEKIMVFENLQIQGYEVAKHHKLSEAQITAGLIALAKFHSISIVWEEIKNQKIPEYCGDKEKIWLHTFFSSSDTTNSGYKYFKASAQGAIELGKIFHPEDIELPRKIEESSNWTLDILNDDNPWKKVLCQGDLWGFNMLFKEGEKLDAKVIDFQMCRYAPPAHDVTMFIYMATETSLRRKCIAKFYDCYYQALQNELARFNIDIKSILSRDEYAETCKVYIKVAKFIWLKYRQTSEQSHENAKAMQRNYDDMVNVVIESGRPAYIRKLFQIDPAYKKGIQVIFSEYIEIFKYNPLPIEDIWIIIGRKITQTYGRTLDFELIDYTTKEITNVSGYLGNYYQVSLVAKVSTAPKKNELLRMKLFAKMLPKTESLKDFHVETNCGFKENHFYSVIIPAMISAGLGEVQDALPVCYLADRDGLVFDDLVSEFNYEMGKVRESMPLRKVQQGLEALAKLHASGLLLEEKIGVKLPDLYPAEFQETFYTQKEMSKNLLKAGKHGICMGIDLFFSTHPARDGLRPDAETLKRYACQAIDKYTDLIKPSSKYRNTICHGDLWASNLMFSPDCGSGASSKVIDFQSYRYSPCTHDLTQFLYMTMFREERQRHWQDLLRYYYQQFERVFARHGRNVDDFMAYESFLKSVVVEEEFALYQTMTHFQTIVLTPESLQILFADPEKSRFDLFEDRSQHVRHHWQTDALYRERLSGAIEDFREFCLKHVTHGNE